MPKRGYHHGNLRQALIDAALDLIEKRGPTGFTLSEAAKQAGVTLIVNNRPDGEAADQPSGADIEAAARACGLEYKAIPVSGAGFGFPQIKEMRRALDSAQGKVLAFCRSGTRSTMLWAMAEAKAGRDIDAIANEASAAGYDTSPIRPTMELLGKQAG